MISGSHLKRLLDEALAEEFSEEPDWYRDYDRQVQRRSLNQFDVSFMNAAKAIIGSEQVDTFRVVNKAGVNEIYIYTEVGDFGIAGEHLVKTLSDLSGPINVRVNSPGGNVFDGFTIYNALKRYPSKTTCYVDGVAASAASFITQGCDRVLISRQGTMMVHDALIEGFTGNEAAALKMASLLSETSEQIASIYAERTRAPVTAWRAAMRHESWYRGQEAVEVGLADEVF